MILHRIYYNGGETKDLEQWGWSNREGKREFVAPKFMDLNYFQQLPLSGDSFVIINNCFEKEEGVPHFYNFDTLSTFVKGILDIGEEEYLYMSVLGFSFQDLVPVFKA